MAETVERLPGPGGHKRFRDYPWNTWLNGEAYHLHPGTREQVTDGAADFYVADTAMRAYVYRAARDRDVTVKTVRDGFGGLVIEAFPGGQKSDSPALGEG
jgi:hypothetical protein